jgi:hypothetical protein
MEMTITQNSNKKLAALQLEKKVDQILSKTFLSISSKVSKKCAWEGDLSVAQGWYTLDSICNMFHRDPEFFQDIFFNSIVDSAKINDLGNYFVLDSFIGAFYNHFICNMRDLEERTPPPSYEGLSESEFRDAIYAHPDNLNKVLTDFFERSPESCIFEDGNFYSNVVRDVLLSTLAEKLLENVHPKEGEPLFKPVYVNRKSDKGSIRALIRIKPGVYFDLCREYVYDNDRFKVLVGKMHDFSDEF